ncbi:MAG: hypothetical protein RDV41_07180, partial [Planctomycetota bacterium]|nr:hypothetical protein [Planctomycetota bacterium]
MKRLVCLCVALGFALSAHAEVVVLKDGRKFEGTVSESKDAIELKASGATLTFPKDAVETRLKDLDELLKSARSKRSEGERQHKEVVIPATPATRSLACEAALKLLQEAYKDYDTARRSFPWKQYEYLEKDLAAIAETIKAVRGLCGGDTECARAEARYREKADAAGTKPDVHFELAFWCERASLNDLARHEYFKVLSIEPDHAETRERLGQIKHAGRWMCREEKAL